MSPIEMYCKHNNVVNAIQVLKMTESAKEESKNVNDRLAESRIAHGLSAADLASAN